MCRLNQVWGIGLMAFGAGVLVGTWVSAVLFCHFFGIVLLVGGFCLWRKNK